jgi:hypothetical protein
MWYHKGGGENFALSSSLGNWDKLGWCWVCSCVCWELDVPLVVCPLITWFFFVFLDMGSFHFVPCIPPFFGSFGLFMIGRVSLKKTKKEKNSKPKQC